MAFEGERIASNINILFSFFYNQKFRVYQNNELNTDLILLTKENK
jgi:hypothetical protein